MEKEHRYLPDFSPSSRTELLLKKVLTRHLMLQELAETAAAAKQEELSSALSEKVVEGLQKEVRTTQEAQVTVWVERLGGLSAFLLFLDCSYRFRRV